MTRRMRSLDLPEEWFKSTAALGPKKGWSELSSEIQTYREPEHNEEGIWIHVPCFIASAGVQVKTDGFRQRLSRKHGCAHVLENWRAVQRMEPGVQRCAFGRAECVRSRLPRRRFTGDEGDGCRSTLQGSDGNCMVSEQDPCETGKQDLGAGEPGKRAPTGSARKSDNLRNGLRMCGQALRREMDKHRQGLFRRR